MVSVPGQQTSWAENERSRSDAQSSSLVEHYVPDLLILECSMLAVWSPVREQGVLLSLSRMFLQHKRQKYDADIYAECTKVRSAPLTFEEL